MIVYRNYLPKQRVVPLTDKISSEADMLRMSLGDLEIVTLALSSVASALIAT